MSHSISDVDARSISDGDNDNRNMDFSDDDGGGNMQHSEAEEDNTADGNQGEVKDGDDENDDGKRKVTPKVKRVRNPQPKMDAARLKEEKGVLMIEKYFEGFKFKGKGREKEDLDSIMIRLEHWGNRLFPKFKFDDFLAKAEVLGTKKEMQTFLTKYRKDMLQEDNVSRGVDDENEEADKEQAAEPMDEFDMLIAEQIERTRQSIPSQDTQSSQRNTQTTPAPDPPAEIEEAIKARIERNRQIALERRRQRMEQQRQMENSQTTIENSQPSEPPQADDHPTNSINSEPTSQTPQDNPPENDSEMQIDNP